MNEVNYEALSRIAGELNVPVVKTYDLKAEILEPFKDV
jgi:hypothetical protein